MDDQASINKRSRSFTRGRAVGVDLRSLVITHIIEGGGDTDTRRVPRGVYSRVADTTTLSNTAVRNIWDRFGDTDNVVPLPHSGGKEK
jgi:hypothetical protein